MGPMAEPTNIKDELAELRRNGDPAVSDDTKEAIRNLTQAEWEAHGAWVDELVASDFDDVDA